MNVKNFMKPYQEATKKQKYDKVKDVFWSCEDVIQKYVTLKWALRIGITTEEITHLMAMYHLQCLDEELDELVKNMEDSPATTPAV
jgi:hypothetical protein